MVVVQSSSPVYNARSKHYPNRVTIPAPPTRGVATMKHIPEPTIRRFSLYLRLLDDLSRQGHSIISSADLAQIAKASPPQIRRDLLELGSLGSPGFGYPISNVSTALRRALGLHKIRSIYILGSGKLGLALSRYTGFPQRGFTIAGVYDNDPHKIGATHGHLKIRDIRHITRDAAQERPTIAILAVPATNAQAAANTLLDTGIQGILNLAPALIKAPPGMVVQNVDITTELLLLGSRIEPNLAQS